MTVMTYDEYFEYMYATGGIYDFLDRDQGERCYPCLERFLEERASLKKIQLTGLEDFSAQDRLEEAYDGLDL